MRSRSRSPSISPSSASNAPSPSPSPSSSHSPERRRRDREDSFERPPDRAGTRVHVGSLAMTTSTRELRAEFRRFGDIVDLWMARTQPCFAFVVYRYREDAAQAVKRMDGETLHNRRIRVTLARPRTKGTRSGAFNPFLRCYQCGKRGHFSRDCRAHQWSPSPSDTRLSRSWRGERYRYDSRHSVSLHARPRSTSGSVTKRRL